MCSMSATQDSIFQCVIAMNKVLMTARAMIRKLNIEDRTTLYVSETRELRVVTRHQRLKSSSGSHSREHRTNAARARAVGSARVVAYGLVHYHGLLGYRRVGYLESRLGFGFSEGSVAIGMHGDSVSGARPGIATRGRWPHRQAPRPRTTMPYSSAPVSRTTGW